MKLKLLLHLAFLVCFNDTFAQPKKFNKPVKFRAENLRVVADRNEVKGYLFFYTIDKENSRENNYGLTLFDNTMGEIKSIEFTAKDDAELISQHFNGESLCLQFFSRGDKSLEFVLYSSQLEQTGRHTLDLTSDELGILEPDQDGTITNSPYVVYSMPGHGFLLYNQMKLSAVAINKQGDQLWRKEFEKQSQKKFFALQVFTATDEVVGVSELYYDKILKPYQGDNFITLLSPSDGSVINRVAVNSADRLYSFSSAVKSKKGFVVTGSSQTKDNLRGQPDLCLMEFSDGGDVLQTKFVELTGEAKKLSVNGTGKGQPEKFILVSEWVRLSNDHFYGITFFGERTSLAGLRNKNADLAVIELDPNFNFINLSLFNKNALSGSMDFCYSSTDLQNNSLSIVYTFKDAGKLQEGTFVAEKLIRVGSAMADHKLKLPTTSDELRVLEARPGSVAIFEYFKSQKEINMRVESFR